MAASTGSRRADRPDQSAPIVAPVVVADAVGSQRRSGHKRGRVTLAAVLAIVVIATASTLITVVTTAAGRSRPLPVPHVLAPPGRVTAAQLLAYHWRTLPGAPISVRTEGVVTVWTGSRMIVWGGTAQDGDARNDGASYDPRTRTWQMLPPSPLAPRTGSAFAWSGGRLFIWGGRSGGRSDAGFSDGATYDPGTRRWARLPRLSVEGGGLAQAVWTGNRVVLLSASADAHATTHATTVQAHAYNPMRNTWTTLASIQITQTALLNVSTLVVGDQLYAWMPVQTVSSTGLRTGNDGFVYRPKTNSWTPTSLLPAPGGYSVGGALWTGDHVIFEPNGIECTCGGIAGTSTGTWADPHTGQATALPAWQPQPSSGATLSWTGAAIVAVGGPQAAAWDPPTGRWRRLANPPYQGGATQLWTGSELLIWGQLSARPSPDPSAASPPEVAHPTGLELVAVVGNPPNGFHDHNRTVTRPVLGGARSQ